MSFYRKKPVTIEARQFTYDVRYEIADWCGGKVAESTGLSLHIPTLEGETWASEGDYVICGVKGEFYACKPDIFEMTYEAIEKELG